MAAGAAVALGAGIAEADDGAEEINGWTVTPAGGTLSGLVTTPVTLSDPSDSLGLVTGPIVGGWADVSASPLSSVGSNNQFVTPFSTLGQPDNVFINNAWFPGRNGTEAVDLFQYSKFDDWLGVDASSSGSAAATGAASPNDLLVTAIANFTDANKILNAATGADVTQPVSFNTDAVQFLGQLQTAEGTITTHTGSLTSLVDQLFLVPLDQGWVDTSDAALQGAQELSTGASGLDIGLEVPSLQLMGDFFASLPIIGAADFF